MSWKKLKNIKHMVPEQMIQDATGNIHKKCKAYKQAEGGHFETSLWYLKKQFWIIFKVLVSFFFYNDTENFNWVFLVPNGVKNLW